MKLRDVLSENCIRTGAVFSDKKSVLEQIARIVVESAGISDLSIDEVLDDLLERERICTTGFGGGLAVPHCRLARLKNFVAGALTIPDGVDFDALDSQPVKLIFFLAGPEEGKSEHVHLLSAIAQLCRDDEKKNALMNSGSPKDFYNLLNVGSSVSGEPARQVDKELMTVFVHAAEDIYLQLLEVFAALDDVSVSTVNTERCSGSLMAEPIFLGLMGDTKPRTGWIIFALVSKAMTNEIVRRIESITGPLGQEHDVLVTIQDIIYSKGSLNL